MPRPNPAIPALVFLVVVAQAAFAGTDDADRRALVGSWKAVSLQKNGEDISLEAAEDTRLVFKADGYAIRKGNESLEDGTYRLGGQGDERELDTMPTNGPDRGKTIRGIYQLEGDTLRMCLAPPGAPRPATLASKGGSNHLLFVYKRVRK